MQYEYGGTLFETALEMAKAIVEDWLAVSGGVDTGLAIYLGKTNATILRAMEAEGWSPDPLSWDDLEEALEAVRKTICTTCGAWDFNCICH